MRNTPYHILSKIINLSIASANLEDIKLPTGKLIRGQIHVLIYGRIGSGKSSILTQIEKVTTQKKIFGLTRATLLGAVDKASASFKTPVVWDCRNSALLIDEFQVDIKGPTRDMLNMLLPMVETSPEYKKPIGYRCNEFKKRDKGGLFCIVKNNTIHCKSRFVLIANTMMELEKTKLHELKALMTRCVLVPHNPDMKSLKEIAYGKKVFLYKKLKVKNKRITKKIFEKVINLTEKYEVKEEDFLRVLGDICRMYYISGWDEELFSTVIRLIN